MSTFYKVTGNMKVVKSAKVRRLLGALLACASNLEIETITHEHHFEVGICGGMLCSYAGAVAIDNALLAFGPYVLEATYFRTECDGEEATLWVGKAVDIKTKADEQAMETAREAFYLLSKKNAAVFLQELTAWLKLPE